MRYDAFFVASLLLLSATSASASPLDDGPARPGEWGFRPADGATLAVTPPGFAWRPQKKASSYEIEVRGQDGPRLYRGIGFSVFCPPEPLPPGDYTWRYRSVTGNGERSPFSRARRFTVPRNAAAFPLPGRKELLARIPEGHPRLFVRPEDLPSIRDRAQGGGKQAFRNLVRHCERLLKTPPSTDEPAKYPEDMVRKSEAWRKRWWGNRVKTIRVLESAATLAFTGRVSGREDFRDLAERLLLDAARWDPRGATGFFYNDEAGMPFAYHFSRAYTFLHDRLSETERETCRDVMRVRGRDMYARLHPHHLWRPFSSHANRAWHFLGEVGIAFLGEIPEAADWVWFAMNVFRCVYPVWCDDDGGWHEGMSYWMSYIGRFTWWAEVMKTAVGIDAYDKPYFSQVGYYPLYMMPPGHRGGGFGDLCARRRSSHAVPLMAVFAAQAGNPHWRWYVEAHGKRPALPGYIGFLHGALPSVEPEAPADLPASRLFEGTGQAVLNETILRAEDNVQVLFKSSPFGSQSHGYEAQNAFLVNAFGERLFIRSGRRDIYGSEHHRNWMWHTKSVNSVTVDGKSQKKRSRLARGEILEFHASEALDYVSGEAGSAYGDRMKQFTRRILFVKPDLVLIFDTLIASAPATFEWRLHAPHPLTRHGGGTARTEGKNAAARVDFLWPDTLQVSVTDRFDPPPRPRIRLTEYHLTAATPVPSRSASFVTAIRIRRAEDEESAPLSLTREPAGFLVEGSCRTGELLVLLRTGDGPLSAGGVSAEGRVTARIAGKGGKVLARFSSEEGLEEEF